MRDNDRHFIIIQDQQHWIKKTISLFYKFNLTTLHSILSCAKLSPIFVFSEAFPPFFFILFSNVNCSWLATVWTLQKRILFNYCTKCSSTQPEVKTQKCVLQCNCMFLKENKVYTVLVLQFTILYSVHVLFSLQYCTYGSVHSTVLDSLCTVLYWTVYCAVLYSLLYAYCTLLYRYS